MFKRLISAAVLLPAASGAAAPAPPRSPRRSRRSPASTGGQGGDPGVQKKHPDVEIKLVSRAYPDHHTAMTTALALPAPTCRT